MDGLIPWLIDRSKQSAISDLFKNMVPQQSFTIDPNITPEMAANIRYKSALAQMASLDPERYGAAAMQANSPDAELDSRLKSLQLENAKNGGIMGDSVQAQVINSYIRMGIPPQKAMMMVMSPELVQQGNALSNFAALHGLGGVAPNDTNTPQASNPNITDLASQMQGLGGAQAAPAATTPNMPATPAQMQQAASQIMPQAQPQAIPEQPTQPQQTAAPQAVNPLLFNRQYWDSTPEGQRAIQTAATQLDPQKYYDEQFKQASDVNKYSFEQAGKLSDTAKIEQENIQKVNATDSQLADIQARIDDVLSQPGFNSIFGSIDARTPDISQSASNAASSLRSLGDKTSLTALQIIRNNSPTGGAAGNMTEKEWPRFEKYFGNIDRAQDPEMARKNLEDQKQAVLDYRNKLREAAGLPKIEMTQKDQPNVIKFDSSGNRIDTAKPSSSKLVYDPATGELK